MRIDVRDLFRQLEHIKLVLLHGDDYSRIASTVAKIRKQFGIDPQLGEIQYRFDDLESDPQSFFTQASSPSFIGRKLIQVRDLRESFKNNSVKDFLLAYKGENVLLFWADSLPKNASLRAVFERSSNMLSATLYSKQLSGALLDELCKKYRLIFDDDAKAMLENLAADYDRLMLASELKKIRMYLGRNGARVTLKDVTSVCSVLIKDHFNLIAIAIADGDVALVDSELSNLIAKNLNSIAIVRIVVRYFRNLLATKLRVEQGDTLSAAMKRLKAKIHFSIEKAFSAQVKRLSAMQIRDSLLFFESLENLCRVYQIGVVHLNAIILFHFFEKKF